MDYLLAATLLFDLLLCWLSRETLSMLVAALLWVTILGYTQTSLLSLPFALAFLWVIRIFSPRGRHA